MSRYCNVRYRVIKTRYRVIFPDIGPDIGNIGPDIGTISGHTRFLPYPILPISCPISCFFPISDPISGQYRDIPVPCQTRYRVFHRYRARYGPDIAKNIGIYGYRVQKTSISFPMCIQYHNIPMSGISDIRVFFLISGTIYHLLCSRPPPAAAQALRPLSRRSNWSSL